MARIRIMPVTPEDGDAALEAFARYGKGQNHPAQLNLADRLRNGETASATLAVQGR
jgi:uncharacterized protein with PIN domain